MKNTKTKFVVALFALSAAVSVKGADVPDYAPEAQDITEVDPSALSLAFEDGMSLPGGCKLESFQVSRVDGKTAQITVQQGSRVLAMGLNGKMKTQTSTYKNSKVEEISYEEETTQGADFVDKKIKKSFNVKLNNDGSVASLEMSFSTFKRPKRFAKKTWVPYYQVECFDAE